jgi:adenosylcobyric acid synthase
MVQGASSSAGKSLVVTALCRLLRRRGVDVVPFKAQNMSNNARVVDGGEIGTAQWLQALAAGVEPDVRMNPVLVKPEGDDRSQVIVLGRPDAELSRRRWRERPDALWPAIESSLRELGEEHELVLLEGAGSPAEINLRSTDLANMRVARAADARVLLVADIDRGGAFAHLYGTWALLDEDDRARIDGFVLNKFRGDASLLAPAPALLEELTGVPTIGVLPWLRHGLPDEDGAAAPAPAAHPVSVAVVRYPTASNLDELKPLEHVAHVAWTASAEDVANSDLVVLPGSKNVEGDLAWLREQGLDEAVRERARSGRRVLGICGGLQLLGRIGLLPVETTYAEAKLTEHATISLGVLAAPWAELSGRSYAGYEIRHGTTTHDGDEVRALARGPVLGVSAHGLFEDDAALAALFGRGRAQTLDEVFDALADAAEAHLDLTRLLQTVAA